MALSKTLGRSLAPGGNCFLLGLPVGVCAGLVKPWTAAPPPGVVGV
jgi:hypothetical protein